MPAGVGYSVVSVAMNTGTGSQAITIDCQGKTPKAVAIFATRGTALGTPVGGAMLSTGWSDGTNTRCAANMAEDGAAVASYDTGKSLPAIDGIIVRILATTSEATDGEASLTSFGADTVTINVSDAPTAAVLLEVWAFWGDDLLATAGTVTIAAGAGASATVSGLAFRPRVALAFTAVGGFNTSSANARGSMGAAVLNTDGTVQGQFHDTFFERETPTVSTFPGGGIRDDSVASRITVTALGVLSEEGRYAVTAGTADGFTVQNTSGATGVTIGFLALYTRNLRAWAGIPTMDTEAPGDKSITGIGFRSQCLFAVGGFYTGKNAYVQDGTSEHFCYGVVAASVQRSVAWQIQTSVGTSDDRSGMESKLIAVIDDGGTYEWSASWSAWTNDGATINVDNASPAGDRMVGMLFLEEDAIVLSDTEEISDQTAINVGLATSDTEQISDQSALNVGLATTDTEEIADFVVLVSVMGATDLVTSDTEEISDAAVLLYAMVLSDFEEILDSVQVPATGTIVVSDSEEISDEDLVFLGRIVVVQDTEEITDEIATPLTITAEKAAHRGTTLQGGAVMGWTFQAGAERGRTIEG